MSVRPVWGAFPAARSCHTLDRSAGARGLRLSHTFLLPLLGIIFLLLVHDPDLYIIVYIPGVGFTGWGFFWVILALLLDMGHWGASYTQRNQIPGVQGG